MMKVFPNSCCMFFVAMFVGLNLRAQSFSYIERIKTLNSNIASYLKDQKTGLYFETTDRIPKENKYSWLWPLCALIQAANEQETLEPRKKYMEPVMQAIEQYYNKKQLTGDRSYFLKAQRLAGAAKAYFYKNNRLPGHYWFNAVMLRGFQALYAIDKDRKWIDFFIEDAERIWKNERDEKSFVGKHKFLIDQAAMIEIYARLNQLN